MSKYVEESEQAVEQIAPSAGTVTLVFKENRKFELHVDGAVYHFYGREPVVVPATVLKSKDFHEDIASNFVVKE